MDNDNWVSFARARLDEAASMAVWHLGSSASTSATDRLAKYVLADIAAKRKILDEASRHQDLYTDERAGAYSFVVLVLCEPWASHPEYPGERP